MSTQLFVRLHRDASVPGAAFDWVLRERNGRELRRGQDVLGRLPRADEVTGVIAHDLAQVRAVSLPPGPRARAPDALANAMEPYLLSDPASNHVVALGEAKDGTTVLAAVSRAWIDPCLSEFARAACPLTQLILETSLPRSGPGTWVAVCVAEGGFLRLEDERCVALEDGTAGVVPSGLKWQIEDATAVGRPPQRLIVYHETAADPDAWRAELGITVETAGRFDWARLTGAEAGFAAKSVPNVLRGILPRSSTLAGGWRVWRTPALLAAAVLVVHVTASVVDWARRARERTHLQAEIQTAFRRSVSASDPIVDATVQSRRALGAAQRAAGQYASDDFVALMSQVAGESAAVPPQSLRAIEYRNGALDLELRGVPKAVLDRIAAQLRSRDLRVETSADARSARLGVRTGP